MGKTEWTRIEKHLYEYQHQDSHGQWSSKYYMIFNDWQGIARRFPLSEKLQSARNKVGEYRRLNDGRYDFDAEKRERLAKKAESEKQKVRGTTFKQFGDEYFAGRIPVPLVRGKRPKRQRTKDREEEIYNALLPYFGDTPMCDIKKPQIFAFAAEWVKVPVTTGRKKDDTSPRDIAPQLKFLRYLLNRAVDNDVLDAAPKIRTPQSEHRKGDITQAEYDEMRQAMEREQERYLICLWETGWRLNEPRKLNWSNVDLKKRVLRLNPEDVKEDYARCTPISPELMKVLLELKSGVANIKGAVFVRKNGKAIRSIREAFNVAREQAGIPNAIPHDIRRSTIRRWEALGISRQAVMQATGHRPGTVHEKYAELSEDQLVEAFKPLMKKTTARAKVAKAV